MFLNIPVVLELHREVIKDKKEEINEIISLFQAPFYADNLCLL